MRGKDKVNDAAENIKPYVERAMEDEKLRDDVMRAFGSAREIYKDLMGEKSARHAREPRRHRRRHPRQAARRDRGSPARERAPAREEGALGAQHDPARRRHRARAPLQPDHGPGDAPIHQGHAGIGRRVADTARRRLERPRPVKLQSGPAPRRRPRQPSRGMSVDRSAIAPGSGARATPGGLGAQPVATGNGRFWSRRHDCEVGRRVDGAVVAEVDAARPGAPRSAGASPRPPRSRCCP